MSLRDTDDASPVGSLGEGDLVSAELTSGELVGESEDTLLSLPETGFEVLLKNVELVISDINEVNRLESVVDSDKVSAETDEAKADDDSGDKDEGSELDAIVLGDISGDAVELSFKGCLELLTVIRSSENPPEPSSSSEMPVISVTSLPASDKPPSELVSNELSTLIKLSSVTSS